MTERDNRAQDLVRTLLAEGWSQAEIARRIGRDPPPGAVRAKRA